jgi:hypothetical protein
MEDNFNFKVNGRRPQLIGKWKKTSIYWQMEDDNFLLQATASLANPGFS